MAKQASKPGSRRSGGGAGAEGDARPAGKWPAGCVAVSRDGRVVLVGQTRGVIVAYDAATSHVADIFRVRPLSSPPSPHAHTRTRTHTHFSDPESHISTCCVVHLSRITECVQQD